MTVQTETAQLIVQLIPLMMRSMTADLRCYGAGLAPTQFRVLEMLVHHSLSLTALAEYQAVTLASMSNTVATLVERGLVRRVPSPVDRRVTQFTITPEGIELMKDARRQLHRRVEDLLASLPAEEVAVLGQGISILCKVLESDEWRSTLSPCDRPRSNGSARKGE